MGADCDNCPFKEQLPIKPSEPTGHRKLTVVVDGPDGVDTAVGEAAAGKTGRFLHRVWKQIGVERTNVSVRTATLCQPPFGIGHHALAVAADCCRPRLAKELADLREGELVLAMGRGALLTLTGKGNVDDWRGYPLQATLQEAKHATIFPTYHPRDVAASPQLYHVLKRDVRIAWDYVNGDAKPIDWPTIYTRDDSAAEQALVEIVEGVESGAIKALGLDVETGGDWTTRLMVVGFASADRAVSLSFPFANEHIEAYATYLLAHGTLTKVTQNGNHDLLSLRRNGFAVNGPIFDTIVAGRVLFPDLDHDLGFMATFYFFISRWKSEFHVGDDRKGSESWLKYMDKPDRFNALKHYNGQDAWATLILMWAMERALAKEIKS